MNVDLAFQIQAEKVIPADHGYPLFSAISEILPEVHHQAGIAIHPIRGRQIGNRQLILTQQSRLTIRVPDSQIAPLLKLSGKSLRIGDVCLRVGVPQVRALIPSSAVRSRLVTIKVKDTPAKRLDSETFTVSVRKQLAELGISNQVTITSGKRRTLRIKDQEIVGYEVILEALTAEESLAIQEKGVGGRRHMGCGVFVALRRMRTS